MILVSEGEDGLRVWAERPPPPATPSPPATASPSASARPMATARAP